MLCCEDKVDHHVAHIEGATFKITASVRNLVKSADTHIDVDKLLGLVSA